MPITLQHLPEGALLLRAGPDHFSAEDKDPYIFSAVVIVTDGVAEIQGASGNITLADVRKTLDAIKSETGADQIRWERANGKKVNN
jgi:hypothetical protein